MTIGVTEEHTALADAVRRWAADQAPVAVARAAAEDGGKEPAEVWASLAAQGLLAMHVAEEHGGAGGTAVEAAVALEQLGAGLAAAMFLPTVVVSSVLQLAGRAAHRLAGLADGTTTATVATITGSLTATEGAGGLTVTGTVSPVLGAEAADLLLLLAADGRGGDVAFVVEASRCGIRQLDSLDQTRPAAAVDLQDVAIDADDVLDGWTGAAVVEVAVAVAAAEAAGLAGWCLQTAVDYAKVREQFGRPIGQFQAIKHACAEMLTQVEQARAAAWDAARAVGDPQQRSLASAVAGAVVFDAAVQCAKSCIQILGGIGYTWEHDAHLFLRRAIALRQVFGPTGRWRAQAAQLALAGTRRGLGVDLSSPDTDRTRAEVAEFLQTLTDLDDDARRRAIADAGYVQPHWPAPYGRAAAAVEQLVIDEEFASAGVKRPDLVIGGWILPTLIAHGTAEQQRRFIRPTLYGEITWCQMFSEPGAGSDLAALSTKATRVDGGWVLAGQKVWTSLAHRSDWGLCLARTNPDVPKHEGITCFVIDMKSEGLDIRPLRELTGRAMFNEVFLNDVFVPDDLVVGAVDHGWRAGRTTLANERVAMSTGSTMGAGVEGVLQLLGSDAADPVALDRAGQLVCEGQVLSLLGLRTTLRRLEGVDPGAASSVRKLVGMHHAQDCAELLLELLGPAGIVMDGAASKVAAGFLQSRCLTIAGGTTEVQRNVVAERILGLPRDDTGAHA